MKPRLEEFDLFLQVSWKGKLEERICSTSGPRRTPFSVAAFKPLRPDLVPNMQAEPTAGLPTKPLDHFLEPGNLLRTRHFCSSVRMNPTATVEAVAESVQWA